MDIPMSHWLRVSELGSKDLRVRGTMRRGGKGGGGGGREEEEEEEEEEKEEILTMGTPISSTLM